VSLVDELAFFFNEISDLFPIHLADGSIDTCGYCYPAKKKMLRLIISTVLHCLVYCRTVQAFRTQI
jgi:hypothetical protein